MMNKILLMTLLMALFAGCTSQQSAEVYRRGEAQRPADVFYGEVVHVRNVLIEGTQSKIGAGSGAVVGGIAGSTIGKGSGRRLGTAVGAIAGGVAGAAAEEGLTRESGVEVTVDLADGRTLAVVQDDDVALVPGQRVRVVRSGAGSYRVYPY
ncbi:MAG: glycine zipper 2TM domain-containing protein [Pseudomonadota bacterium]|nr:glycine zipper 2TM domain-containing protein [Pseudomonadota bacterium]